MLTGVKAVALMKEVAATTLGTKLHLRLSCSELRHGRLGAVNTPHTLLSDSYVGRKYSPTKGKTAPPPEPEAASCFCRAASHQHSDCFAIWGSHTARRVTIHARGCRRPNAVTHEHPYGPHFAGYIFNAKLRSYAQDRMAHF